MLIKLNTKLLNAYALIKSNAHLLDRHLLDAAKRGSSISITLPDDELPAIRSKYEKLYANKYFKNRNKDEFKSKLIDYFDEIGIDYAKMVNKVNRLDHPSIKAISFYANNYNNELVQIKKLVLNLFTHSLNAVYCEQGVSPSELNSQMMVAELVQLLHIVHQIHANLIHLSEFEAKSLHDGNKLSILSGDFLFAIVMRLLAKIGNSDVTISITDAVNSMNFGQFILAASESELLANMTVTKWLELVDLIYAFSFRKGCESIAELINASVSVKLIASEFGRNFALALQASTELDQLKRFVGLNSQPFGNLNSQAYSPGDGSFVKSPEDSIEIVGTALHPVLNLSSTHTDLFQLPIILDGEQLPGLVRKVQADGQSNTLKPQISYAMLKDHLPVDGGFPKTMQFIQLYANQSIQCLDKLFSQSNLETNELLKDFVYTILYGHR